MKKYLSILLVAMGVALLMPMGAKASFALDTDNACEESKVCETDSTKCEQTCYIKIKNNTAEISVGTSIKLGLSYGDGVTLKSATASTNFDKVDQTATNLEFLTTSSVTASSFTIATLVFEVEKGAKCSVSLSLNGVDYTIEETTETEVKTGATLPIAIITCAAVAAGVVYFTSKKTKKLYKI